jgi:acetylxylan esterase
MPRYENGIHALSKALGWRIAVPMAIVVCGVPGSASAGSLSAAVTGWSANDVPTYISMYEYVPAKLAASPPVLVAAHYCGGSASQMFSFTGMPAIEAAADMYGFVMIFPQTTNPATSADCWDVGSTKSLTHNGGGDTQAIAEMVKYEVSKRGANADRVYAMGASSGAMLTEALMAVYPDVFKAGAEFSGVPAGCWSDGWSAASNWGGTCANGNDTMTATAWGNLARGMYPGYTGYRPRLQLWHGTADATINYANMGQAILQWTNVLDLNATPNSTDTTTDPGYTIEKWQNTCGFTVLEAHTQAGGGHTTPINATSVIDFFGLNQVTGPDPQVAACSDAGSSASGSTTSSGSGSGSSTGSSTSGGGNASSSAGSTHNASTGGSTSGSSGSKNSNSSNSSEESSNSSAESSSSAEPPNSGCSCGVPTGGGPTRTGAIAAVGLLGIVLGSRRRRRN